MREKRCNNPSFSARPGGRSSRSANGSSERNSEVAREPDEGVLCVLSRLNCLLGFLTAHLDNKPIPDPSQEGSERSLAPCQVPSWEGSGAGREKERHWLPSSRLSPLLRRG